VIAERPTAGDYPSTWIQLKAEELPSLTALRHPVAGYLSGLVQRLTPAPAGRVWGQIRPPRHLRLPAETMT
jgi:hypothetical protein